ncbi:hypothetical protein GCM10028807_41000 [Spirosoma daeguense]
MERVRNVPGVKIHTSLKPQYAGAVGLFSIGGMKPAEIDGQLMNKYKIHTVRIEWENIRGVRVTTHVYHSPKDLDRLVTAIKAIAEKQATASKQKKS